MDEKNLTDEERTKTQTYLSFMTTSYRELLKLGWKEPHPQDKKYVLEILELGSTGIHSGWRDAEGHYWVEGDIITPMLVKHIRPLRAH